MLNTVLSVLQVFLAAGVIAWFGQLQIFTRVIASAVLLSVFLFVGFIAYAIVSAVFQLSSSFQM